MGWDGNKRNSSKRASGLARIREQGNLGIKRGLEVFLEPKELLTKADLDADKGNSVQQ